MEMWYRKKMISTDLILDVPDFNYFVESNTEDLAILWTERHKRDGGGVAWWGQMVNRSNGETLKTDAVTQTRGRDRDGRRQDTSCGERYAMRALVVTHLLAEPWGGWARRGSTTARCSPGRQ